MQKQSKNNKFEGLIILQLFIALFAFNDKRPFFLLVQSVFLIYFICNFYNQDYKFSSYSLWSIEILLISLISIFYSTDQFAVLKYSISFAQPLIFANLLIPYMIQNENNFFLTIKALIISCFFIIIRMLISTPLTHWGTERLGFSINYNPNTIGAFTALCCILSIIVFLTNKNKIYLIFSIMIGLFSLFSGSRKALLIILIGLIFIWITSFKLRLITFFELFILLFSLYFLYHLIMTWGPLYNILGVRVTRFFGLFTGEKVDNSTLQRISMIFDGWSIFKLKPLFGYGLANFASVLDYGYYAHNNYIELLVSFGLIGTIIYYSLHVKIIIYSIMVHNRINQLFGIIVLLILIADIFDVSYYREHYQIILAITYASTKITFTRS